MTNAGTYKGFTIQKSACSRANPWVAFDADGELFDNAKTKSQLCGGISAYRNGDAWKINELRRDGYSKA
jgi:hypothetical protein